MSTYARVTKKNPCEVCGGESWCWFASDGLARGCMRSEGDPWHGIEPTRESDINGIDFWLYLENGSSNVAEPSIGTSTHAIGADARYRVYRQLIKRLQLDRGPIRSWLVERGLPAETVEQLLDEGLCILDRGKTRVAKELIDIGLETQLAGTPGFYIDDRYGRQVWNIAGRGVLIPCRDTKGRIIAAQIRRTDEGHGPRYFWLSSAKQGGASPGSPIHVPRFDGDTSTVRVTEGLLKAEIATRLSGIRTLGIAGTGWRELCSLVPKLQPARLLIAYDADFQTNGHILNAIRGIANEARNWSCDVFVETWRRQDGKGIDDVLVTGHSTSLVPADEFLAQTRSDTKPRATVTVLEAVQAHLDRLSDQPDIIRTGLYELDGHIGGGLEFGEIMIFGARPNHGKSAVGQQLLYAFAKQGLPGLFVSLEMAQDRIGKRAVQHITTSHVEHWQAERHAIIGQANRFFAEERAAIYIDDRSRSLSEIQQSIADHVERHAVKTVLVDYIQLVDAPGRSEYDRVSAASKQLAQLTSELGILTVLLAQVGRAFEQRGNAKQRRTETVIPTMAELKGSGQLEQDASVIVFGVHPKRYDDKQPVDRYLMQVPKVRHRECDPSPFLLRFDPSRMAFSDPLPERIEAFDTWSQA